MSAETHPLALLDDAALEKLLGHAMRNILILGLVAACALWLGSNWQNAAMMAVGALISAASILEWRRLIRIINAKLDKKQTPAGATLAILFFVFRLTIFAGVIYGTLKCFRGSLVALLSGLALAVIAMAWEAIRLLKE